jgi:hypothetical protein
LGALFVLVAACAVLVAGIAPLARVAAQDRIEVELLLAALAAGSGTGLLLGLIVGAHQFRRATGLVWGAAVGPVVGAIAGLMALVPGDQIATAAAAMVAGSGLVVGVALLMRQRDQ